MDEWHYELAAQREHADRERGVDRSRDALRSPDPDWIDGCPYCAECGNALPLVRAETGRGRCVPCQERYERGLA